MSKSIKAFPNSSPFNTKEDGMDLRDYFAAMAMQGLVVEGKCSNATEISQIAWSIADKMIDKREF